MPVNSISSGNSPFALSTRDVHVWVISKPAVASREHLTTQEKYACLLSEDETAKAAAFKFEKDRLQSILSRGILRCLLGNYLGVAPQTFRFNYNQAGKPSLPELGFNVSHSQDRILIALAREQDLGVDIEYKKSLTDIDSMIRLVLSDDEKTEFNALEPALRTGIFYEYWAHKEAYIKAIGMGLSCSLKEAEFHLGQNDSLELVRIAQDEQNCQVWSVFPLAIDKEYAAALFIKGKGWQVSVREWLL